MSDGFELAWRKYKQAWARSLGPHAGARDIDADAKRLALRAFRAGWRAAMRQVAANGAAPQSRDGST